MLSTSSARCVFRWEGWKCGWRGDRACEAPRRYTRIRLVYEVQGLGVGEEEKVRRAIALSHEKYCSVLHTLRPDVEVRSELVVA